MTEYDNLSCQWLIGHEVRSRAGEPLGRIVDLRVEPDYGPDDAVRRNTTVPTFSP